MTAAASDRPLLLPNEHSVQPGREVPVHPVYLDVPMMASFYATEGLEVPADKLAKHLAGRESEVEVTGEGRVGISQVLSWLADFSVKASAGGKSRKRAEESVELRSFFHHTEASLFNLLRHQLLRDGGRVFRLSTNASGSALRSHEQDAPNARPVSIGDLVEITGAVVGNPLEHLLEMYERLLPYKGIRGDPSTKTKSVVPGPWWWPWKSVAPGKLIEELLRDSREKAKLVRVMREDLERASARDLLVRNENTLTTAVVVVSRESFTDEAASYLLDGEFTVMGKVTRVLTQDTPLDLTRRTALGIMVPEEAKQLVDSLFAEISALGARKPGGLVSRVESGVQLLPLAIYA